MAAAVWAGSIGYASDEVYIGDSAFWSAPNAWLDNSAPLPGGDPSATLVFTNRSGATVTAMNDLPGAFALNRLVLVNDSTNLLTIAAVPGSSLAFTGTNPRIAADGLGAISITAPVSRRSPADVLTISGSGPGAVTISGYTGGATTAGSLMIAATPAAPDLQMITIRDASLFSDGLRLHSGNVGFEGTSVPGSGVVEIAGGTISFLNPGITLLRPISLEANLVVQTASAAVLSAPIISATPGTGLSLRTVAPFSANSASLILTAASTYSGATTLDNSLNAASAGSAGGTLQLSGDGALVQTSAIKIRAGSKLTLAGAAIGPVDRIPNIAPVRLESGELAFGGATGAAVPTSEELGAIDLVGYSRITLVSNPSGFAELRGAQLNRSERGTLLIRGSGLGNPAGPGTTGLRFNTAPGGLVGGGSSSGVNTSILPYAMGDASTTGTGTTFVTFSPSTGMRLLNLGTDFATSLPGNTSTVNLRLSQNATINQASTFNSLLLDGGTISGPGVLTIQSGAILQRLPSAALSNPLNFGSVEANIFAVADMTLSGVISGSGGLTKSGLGQLTMTGTNTLTGPLTINAGRIRFETFANLGADVSPIVLANQGAGLIYAGNNALTFTRNLETRVGLGSIDLTGAGDLTLAGSISGPGGMRYATGVRTLTLTGSNTYLGATRISGNLVFGGNAAFGSGPIDLSVSSLSLSDAWSTGQEITLSNSTILRLRGADAHWNGPVQGAGALSVIGPGRLRLGAASPYSGNIPISGATVELGGEGALRSTNISLSNGARLVLDNSGTANERRVSDSAIVTLSASELVLEANETRDVVEHIARVTVTGGGLSTITLLNEGSRNAALSMSSSTGLQSGELLVRGNNLGGLADSAFTRVMLKDPSGLSSGFLEGIVADTDPAGPGTSFALYDQSVDAAGRIGLRALRPSEYTPATTIENPAVPANAHVMAGPVTTVAGTANRVQSLTLPAGGSLTLDASQTLDVTSGAVFLRGMGAITGGGTFDFGSARGLVHTAGDVQWNGLLAGTGGLRKSGTGALTFRGLAGYTGTTTVAAGTLRIGADNPFRSHVITLGSDATVEVLDGATTLGGLAGNGTAVVGNGAVTIGSAPIDAAFSGALTGTGTITIVDGGRPSAVRSFLGTSTFSGPVTLQSGRVELAGFDALGTGPLVVNGGSLGASSPFTGVGNFQLNTDLPVVGSFRITLGHGTAISGPGKIVVRSREGLGIAGPIDVPGGLTATRPEEEFLISPGTIEISGPAGSLSTSGGIHIESKGQLWLNDTVPFTGGAGGRLGDATTVYLGGATLRLSAATASNQVEAVGALSGAGFSTLLLAPGTASTVQLNAVSIDRIDRGTFTFQSTRNLGGPLLASNVAQLKLTNPPELVGGIVPWAVGISLSGAGIVTYDTNGVRLLTGGEFRGTLAGAAPTDNVRLLVSEENNSSRAINSLVLNSNSITGSGALSIQAGTIVQVGGSSPQSIITNMLDFGSREAFFHFPGNTPGSTLVSGEIRGTNGLTKSGGGRLYLTGSNTFTGRLTINDGPLFFSSIASLGLDTSPIQLRGYNAQLIYNGTPSTTLSRDIDVSGLLATIGGDAPLTLTGRITGAERLHLVGRGPLVLNGTNALQAPLVIEGGVAISSDSALGASDSVVLGHNPYGLRLDAPWNTLRDVSVAGNTRINTNGFDAVLAGPLSGGGSVIKLGAGALELRTVNPYAGSFSIAGGSLVLSGNASLEYASVQSSHFTVRSGAVFILDNSTGPTVDRLRDGGPMVFLDGGELRLVGGTETIGRLFTQGLSFGTVTATGNSTLRFSEYTGLGGILFRGDGLSSSARITFSWPPALNAGLIPGAFAHDTASGGPVTFATYDLRADAAGVIGVRPLASGEYVAGAEIRNARNGGTTPVDANFLGSGPVTVGGASNSINSLTLTGTSAVTLAPEQVLKIGAPGVLVQPTADATVSGGWLGFAANPARVHVVGDSRLVSSVDASTLVKTGAGLLRFEPATPFAGAGQIIEGTLRVSSNVLRNANVTVASAATFDVASDSATLGKLGGAGTVNLSGGDLAIEDATTFFGTISGSGAVTIRSSAMLARPQTYTGPTTVSTNSSAGFFGPPATLTLNGNATLATSHVTIANNAVLELASSPSVASRFGSIPVRLNHGRISLIGNQSAPTTQSFGSLTGAGLSTIITLVNENRQAATLNFSSLIREERGTFDFQNGLGGPVNGGSKIMFDPTLANELVGAGGSPTKTPILPFAIDTNAQGLVTFTAAGGIRPLLAAEYSSVLSAGENVRLSASAVDDRDIAVNALVLPSIPLSGTGTLTIESGMLYSSFNSSLGKNVSFGAREGFVFAHGSSSPFLITSVLGGTGGITFSGSAATELQGANTFTGPLTINSGRIAFSSMANLGDPSSITLNNGELFVKGFSNFLFDRTIRLTGFGTLSNETNRITYSAPLTGPGGVRVGGYAEFAAANSYAGDTSIPVFGKLRFASDTALGTGGNVLLDGTIELAGPWETNRTITTTNGVIDTGTFDAIWHGPLLGSSPPFFGALAKNGGGTLHLRDTQRFGGTLSINAGTVRLENGPAFVPNRIADTANLVLAGGGFEVEGHPSVPVEERLGMLTSNRAASVSRLLLETPGTTPTVLHFSSNISAPGALLNVIGQGLGAGPNGGFTRVQIDAPNLVEGALPGMFVSDRAGQPLGYATYDFTEDAAGDIGVRPLRPTEFSPIGVIQNPGNGGGVATVANVRATGALTAIGATNTIETLTLADGAAVQLGFDQTLVLGSRSLLVEPGATATVRGGAIDLSAGRGAFLVSGNLTLESSVVGSVSASGFTKDGPGALTWAGGGPGHDDVLVNAGTLRIGSADAFLHSAVTIAPGATLALGSLAANVRTISGSGDVQLDPGAILTLVNPSTFINSVHGPGTLHFAGGFGFPEEPFVPTGTSDFTGAAIIDGNNYLSSPRALQFDGRGQFTQISELIARSTGVIRLKTTSPSIPAHVPITLQSGTFEVQTGTSALTAGPLTIDGLARVVVTSGPADSVQFNFDELRRAPGSAGQLLARFSNANAGATPGPGVANVRFGPSLTAQLVGAGDTPVREPILPFAIGSYPQGTETNFGLLTYSPTTGLRLLNDAEYSPTMAAGANVRLAGQIVQDNDIAINSLTFPNVFDQISGSGIVRIESGLMLVRNSASISNQLDFGPRTGNIFVTGNLSLSLHGKISGSGGFAVTGLNSLNTALNLSNLTNDFTGPVTLNSARVTLSAPATLGPTSNLLVLNNGSVEISATAGVTLDHPIELAIGGGTIRNGLGTILLRAPISGPGALTLQSDATLAGANTYSGTTTIFGTVTLNSPAGFGASPLVQLDGAGTIRLGNPWTSNAEVRALTSVASIDTNGFDASIARMSSAIGSGFTKRGAGRLTLLDGSKLLGSIIIDSGTLELDGPLATDVTVNPGGTLTGDGMIARRAFVSGTLSPGRGVGPMFANDLSLLSNSTLAIELAAPASSDQVKVIGAFDLFTDVRLTIALTPSFAPMPGDRFILIDNDGGDRISQDQGALGFLTFNGNPLDEAERFQVNGWDFLISYSGGTGNDLELRVVPEPGAAVILAVGVFLLNTVGFIRPSRVARGPRSFCRGSCSRSPVSRASRSGTCSRPSKCV